MPLQTIKICYFLVEKFEQSKGHIGTNNYFNKFPSLNDEYMPLYNTDHGQYLTNNLAEPLIEALTEIVNNRPDDPIEYLIVFLQGYAKIRGTAVQSDLLSHQRLNYVRNQADTDSKFSVLPSKPDTPRVGKVSIPLQMFENGFSTENDITDEDSSLSDSAMLADERDEHGQSMLHFACARSHGRNALIALIDESNIDISYRDELYRTARDVSVQANQPENAKEIDQYIISLAANGDEKFFHHMLINGYDHILDIEDEGDTVLDICRSRGNFDLIKLLENIRPFEERREQIHASIRIGQLDVIEKLIAMDNGSRIMKAKNYYGMKYNGILITQKLP